MWLFPFDNSKLELYGFVCRRSFHLTFFVKHEQKQIHVSYKRKKEIECEQQQKDFKTIDDSNKMFISKKPNPIYITQSVTY